MPDSHATPRLYALPATVPALPALVDALLDGRILPGRRFRDDPLSLADLTLLLPSRRAVRAAEAAFLEALGGNAVLLPRMRPLPDVDEAELAFAEAAEAGAAALDLPPPLPPLDRRFALMRLVMALARRLEESGEAALPARPAEAAHLAAALERVLDEATLEEIDWTRLGEIVPAELDRYFQASARFLALATEAWPDHLAGLGLADPAARRTALIERETARVASGRAGPVVAAAIGAVPSVARLLAAIARAPEGAVVLPGLDLGLDDASWRHVHDSPNHPQHGLATLLARLGAVREDVAPLLTPSPVQAARAHLLGEAMRPAETSEAWREHTETDVSGLALIEAETEREQALAIALTLREAVETPGRTAALVTPDRTLARRVSAELARWGLEIDDSAGLPLGLTPPALFARLVLECVAADLAPVPLLALLKHPLAAFGLPRGRLRRAAQALERAVLRGLRPAPGLAGLHGALAAIPADEDAGRRRIRLSQDELALASELVERLGEALGPLLTADADAGFAARALAHAEACRLAGDERLFTGEAGDALARLMAELLEADHQGLNPSLADYAALFAAFAAERAVRPRHASHPRLHIWGPLEARLQAVDRLVLGGLDEGVWPRESPSDPWLNRAMRASLGLPQAERRIGLSANDFASAFASGEVFLARSLRAGRDPTVPSRFLARLETVLGPKATDALRARGRCYLDWAKALDAAPAAIAVERPRPSPPVAVRPRALSVTEIEDWVRDPYTIYARHILALRPLDPLDQEPAAAERGTLVHGAIASVLGGGTWPPDAHDRLLRAGRALIESHERHPSVVAFWWPRFARIAAWFSALEEERRGEIAQVLAEVSGRIDLDAPAGPFTLRGRADRIDLLKDGRLAVIDYKTGQPATPKEVRAGLSPQIALLGGMARAGMFDPRHRGASLATLGFVRLSGAEPAGELKLCSWDACTLDEAADEALARLAGLIAAFDRADQPYHSIPRPRFKSRYGDYDHLARIREWSLTGGEGEA